MPRLGVYSRDFKFYYEIIIALKKWNIPFVSIDPNEKVPEDVPVILSSENDAFEFNSQIREKDPEKCLRLSFPYFFKKTYFENLIIGIDPGPKPGVAVVADGIVTEARECNSIEDAGITIKKILGDYKYKNVIVRIGNGDRPNLKKLLLTLDGKRLEIINEKGTSQPHKTHDNALSAARIAQIEKFQMQGPSLRNNRRTLIEEEFTTIYYFFKKSFY